MGCRAAGLQAEVEGQGEFHDQIATDPHHVSSDALHKLLSFVEAATRAALGSKRRTCLSKKLAIGEDHLDCSGLWLTKVATVGLLRIVDVFGRKSCRRLQI